jgi:prevent-host-death family protein
MGTHLWEHCSVATPRVLSIRELRANLSDVVDQVQVGEPIIAGAHRKPEVVVMSVELFEALTERQGRALRSAVGSLDMEGLRVSEAGRAALREFAAGRIDFEEYRRSVST